MRNFAILPHFLQHLRFFFLVLTVEILSVPFSSSDESFKRQKKTNSDHKSRCSSISRRPDLDWKKRIVPKDIKKCFVNYEPIVIRCERKWREEKRRRAKVSTTKVRKRVRKWPPVPSVKMSVNDLMEKSPGFAATDARTGTTATASASTPKWLPTSSFIVQLVNRSKKR